MTELQMVACTPATDTRELPAVHVGIPLSDVDTVVFPAADEPPTRELHPVFDPRPPVPLRLPKRLRARVRLDFTLAAVSAAGFSTAIGAVIL